jgi:hypothetical protein
MVQKAIMKPSGMPVAIKVSISIIWVAQYIHFWQLKLIKTPFISSL